MLTAPSAMPRYAALFSVGLFLLAAVAFWPLYLSKPWAAIDRYTHAHALLGTIWLLLLLCQPILILAGYRRAHRLVGRASLFVALGFVLSSVLLTHYRVSRMSEVAFAREGIYIYLPLAIAVLFAAAFALGIRWRASAPVHARFMLFTGILLLDPVVARIMFFYLPRLPSDDLYQGITFTVITAVMIHLLISLPRHAPGRTWYRNYCVGTVAVFILYFVIPYTGAWRAFVEWFRSVPLT